MTIYSNHDLMDQVFKFTKEKHKGQKDDNGDDYFEYHLFPVYKILLESGVDLQTMAAGVLHDTLEDTPTTYEELEKEFGKEIADLVLEVTHEGKKDEKGFYFPRLKSKKAIMVKFADRLSNLSRMQSWSEERQDHYLRKSKFWRSE